MIDDIVNADFDRARTKAFIREVRSFLRRQPNQLIPYHEIRKRVGVEAESYRGMQTVPIDRIVGSVDRYSDFDRAFLPKGRQTAGRWKSIDRAFYQDVVLPPIQLYKVGDIYFVKDGNHRVSVARERGGEFIDAEVIEGHIRAPLYATMSPQQLLMQVEYAEFLRRTNLDRLRPDHDIHPTSLGRYDELWEHIRTLQDQMEMEGGAPVPTERAVLAWYDQVFLPIVTAVRKQGILKRFPGRSATDVYLWVIQNRQLLAPGGVATSQAIESTQAWAEAEATDVITTTIRHATDIARDIVGMATDITEATVDLAMKPVKRTRRKRKR